MALCQQIDQTFTVPLHDGQRTAAALRELADANEGMWQGCRPPECVAEECNDLRALAAALDGLR